MLFPMSTAERLHLYFFYRMSWFFSRTLFFKFSPSWFFAFFTSFLRDFQIRWKAKFKKNFSVSRDLWLFLFNFAFNIVISFLLQWERKEAWNVYTGFRDILIQRVQNLCLPCTHFFVHILKSKLSVVTPKPSECSNEFRYRFEALSSTNFSKVGCGGLFATAALWVRIQTKQRHGQYILAHEKKLYRTFVKSLSENRS